MKILRNFVLVLFLQLLLQAGLAQAEGPVKGTTRGDVEVVLQQHKVVKHGKHEALEAADGIKPGETVEYQATYRNTTHSAVHQLYATLPIPAETEYLPGSAKPARVEASLDSVNYAPVPLRRKVTLANGQIEERDIPASEYRSLRWAIGDLAADAKITVFARVRLAPVGQAKAEEGKK